MSIIGRAITRLAMQCGGQLLLELPDDLPPHVVSRFVNAANDEAGLKDFALFANDRRVDTGSIKPRVSYRELAAYRQGNHVALAYASDNRGMHTYTSVYPNLLAPGFPDELEETVSNGVGSLRALSAQAAAVISERHHLVGDQAAGLEKAIPHVAKFLADAYLVAGNGQTSLAADWWFHADEWLTSLDEWLDENAPCALSRSVFGSAGLPYGAGMQDGIQPRDLVRLLMERWGSPESVREELARLSGDPKAAEAADLLEGLPWDVEMPKVSIRTNSALSRVALIGSLNAQSRADRTRGWSLLDAAVLKDAFVEAKDKLSLRISGVDVPRPWSGGPAVVTLAQDAEGDDGWVDLGEVQLVVPWKGEAIPDDQLPAKLESEMEVRGGRKCEVAFTVTSKGATPSGLKLGGALKIKPWGKVPNSASIAVSASPKASPFVVDQCSMDFTLVRHNEVVLYLRAERTRSRRKSALGPYLWREGAQAPTAVPLLSPGRHSVAAVAGSLTSAMSAEIRSNGDPIAGAWPCDALEGKYALGELQLEDGDEIIAPNPIFAVEINEQGAFRHLSPVIAAAFAQNPDNERQVPDSVLAMLDGIVTDQLKDITSGGVLGATFLSSGVAPASLQKFSPGCLVDAKLSGRLGVQNPSIPTPDLTTDPRYEALMDAYQALGILERIELLEQGDDASSLTISRLSLEFIGQDRMDALLQAYLHLVQISLQFDHPVDKFWAKHPFTVVVFPDALGSQSASAVLPSPLHPLRLAWLWMVQKGLRAAADDTVPPEISLGLLDPTAYPAHLAVADPLGHSGHYIPLPLESSPEGLYMGWQALIRFASGEAKVPDAILGRGFPAEGLSSISSGAVSSAIDDFLRVSPHVQALRIGLESTMAARRSQALDAGVLDKIATLARQSAGLESIGGVTVLDSTNRQGHVPSFRTLAEPLKAARPGFNVSWSSRLPDGSDPVHVSFLEGTAARLALSENSGTGVGWVPAIPLRRFPRRVRPTPGVTDLDYSLPAPSEEASPFQNALSAYETSPEGTKAALRVIPNLASLPTRPNWLVAGDFGADPQAIADAASVGDGRDYMLWDWRPISTIQMKSSPAKGKVQPYFVLATVPRALSASIAGKIAKLQEGLSPDEISGRTRRLVSQLAKRAIGLNTLLAIGHHQATGALGFYFAIESIARWVAEAPKGETRIMIPVDAVDPYLRAQPGGDGETRRRADLIAVCIRRDNAGTAKLKFVPIEIKHYGLSTQGAPTFPSAGDASLLEHLEQLSAYQSQLLSLASNYMKGASSAASIFGSRLAIVLEAGMQLCASESAVDAPALLADVSSGKAGLDIGKGLLLWYQAGASTTDGKKAAWHDVPGTDENRHVQVRIDPAAFGQCYWSGQGGEPHVIVSQALTCAMEMPADAEQKGADDGSGPEPATSATNESNDMSMRSTERNWAQHVELGSGDAAPVAAKVRTSLGADELEQRYARILSSLEEFNVKARRPKLDGPPYVEGPAFVEYAIEPAYGVSVSKIESQLDNLKLRLKLSSDAQIGCTTHLGNVLLSVPKLDSERYFIDAREVWSRWQRPSDGFRIPLGEDMRGNIVDIDFSSSNSPHVLLAGVTGSGKSEALLTLLHGAVKYYKPSELRLALLDPKRTELVSLDGIPHQLGATGFSAEDAIALLSSAVDEMERRYEVFRGFKVRDIQEHQAKVGEMPRWLMVLDEYADLTSDDDERKEIERHLKRLAQKARAAGIHLIVSTQKPVVSVINTVVKGNLPGRIALRVNTAMESKVILDEGGAEQLTGKGDGLMKVGTKKVRLQFARFSGSY